MTADLVVGTSVGAMLGVPMLKEDKLIGVIAIYRQEVRPFASDRSWLCGGQIVHALCLGAAVSRRLALRSGSRVREQWPRSDGLVGHRPRSSEA